MCLQNNEVAGFWLFFFLIHVSPGSYNIQYGWLIKSSVRWCHNNRLKLNTNTVKGLAVDCAALHMDVVAEELNERRCIISNVHVIFCSCISLKCEFLSESCL